MARLTAALAALSCFLCLMSPDDDMAPSFFFFDCSADPIVRGADAAAGPSIRARFEYAGTPFARRVRVPLSSARADVSVRARGLCVCVCVSVRQQAPLRAFQAHVYVLSRDSYTVLREGIRTFSFFFFCICACAFVRVSVCVCACACALCDLPRAPGCRPERAVRLFRLCGWRSWPTPNAI